jgi:protein-tyrosine phosphatase
MLRLGATAGPIYAKLRFLDYLGAYLQTDPSINPNAHAFLFVCFGNIMRSPMAEALFRKAIEEAHLPMRACSAGLHAIAGTPPDPRALTVAQEMNAPLSGHRAQLLTPLLMAGAEVVFAMDYQNKAELLARYPDHRGKIFMLSAFGEGLDRHREIPDPYSGNLDATRRCYTLLQYCIRNLTSQLKRVEECI